MICSVKALMPTTLMPFSTTVIMHAPITARYTLPAPETINFFVEPSEGHDDFLTSLALCAQALEAMTQPAAGQKIAARPLYPGESRY